MFKNNKLQEINAKMRVALNTQIIRAGEPMRIAMQNNLNQAGIEKLDITTLSSIQAIKDGKLKVKQ